MDKLRKKGEGQTRKMSLSVLREKGIKSRLCPCPNKGKSGQITDNVPVRESYILYIYILYRAPVVVHYDYNQVYSRRKSRKGFVPLIGAGKTS